MTRLNRCYAFKLTATDTNGNSESAIIVAETYTDAIKHYIIPFAGELKTVENLGMVGGIYLHDYGSEVIEDFKLMQAAANA
jgi:hypothetical protein